MKYKDRSYYTTLGRTCVEPGCTCGVTSDLWGPWCYEHNVERIERINADFENIARQMGISWVPFDGQFATEDDI